MRISRTVQRWPPVIIGHEHFFNLNTMSYIKYGVKNKKWPIELKKTLFSYKMLKIKKNASLEKSYLNELNHTNKIIKY